MTDLLTEPQRRGLEVLRGGADHYVSTSTSHDHGGTVASSTASALVDRGLAWFKPLGRSYRIVITEAGECLLDALEAGE